MIQIWDLPTRLYHWIQAVLVFLLLLTGFGGSGDSGGHMLAGLAVMVGVMWRFIWGFWGSDTAKFTTFVPGPSTLVRYLRQGEQPNPGHSPLGALMVCLLLSLLLAQLISGWLISPLAASHLARGSVRVAESVHEGVALAIVGAVSCHLMAIALFQWRGLALVQAMVTGYQNYPGPEPRFVKKRRAALMLLACLLSVAAAASFVVLE